jgi:excisionase family DNA binding protein
MTVIRWIKDGKIPAFKTAGGHRRILRADLERFCQSRGIPFWPEGEDGERRILIVDGDGRSRDVLTRGTRTVLDEVSIETCGDAFTAGCLISTFKPNLLFLDTKITGFNPHEVCAHIARDPDGPIAVVPLCEDCTPDVERSYRSRGALACLPRPPNVEAVTRVVRAAFHLPEDASNVSQRPVVIHIVDTDLRLARSLRRDFEGRLPNCQVSHFDSPIDAMFAVTLDRPDVLVLNVSDLALHADDLIRRIIGRLTDHPIKVIAVGDERADARRDAVLAAGARCLLTKPFEVEDLLAHAAAVVTAAGSTEPRKRPSGRARRGGRRGRDKRGS